MKTVWAVLHLCLTNLCLRCAEAGPLGVGAGGIAGMITGFVTGLTTEAHANTLYEEVPLEYRERAEAVVAHLPYYMFGESW